MSEKKKRSTAKGKFHRIYGRLLESVQDKTDTVVLNKILDDLEMAYLDLEAKHEAYLETFNSDNEEEKPKVNELNHDMTLMYKELCKSRTLCQEKAKRSGKKKQLEELNESTMVREHDTFRVKKLDAPTFSGNLRDYPSFKVDYERHMVSSYGKDPYALKQCLNGEALHVVKGIDNDYDEMFKRLDLKYGRPERLVDNILSELKRLKRIQEGENSKFIAMVETVEKCWLDLKRMNLESEMNTVTVVSQIEKLLPPLQKREWAIQKQRNQKVTDCTPGFQDLLKFMLDEKSALEYMDADLREYGSTKVKIHSTLIDENTKEDDVETSSEKGTINALQQQIYENQSVMKQVVEGLAQVAQAVSKSDNRYARNQQDRSWTTTRNTEKWKCWYHQSENHEIGDCNVFAKLDNTMKMELLRKNGGCFSCLKLGHLSRSCNNRKPCDILDETQQQCGKMHHKFLHNAKVAGTSFHNSAQIVNDEGGKDGVLLMISSVKCKGRSLTALWDPGANMSLITHKAARNLGLSGREITLAITKVGNVTESIQSKEYTLELTDKNGEKWTIRVYGMDEVTADVAQVDVSRATRLFPGIEGKDIQRPTGKVDLLIGTDCCILMPNKEKQVGNLQLMKNQFGYCIRGSHSLIEVPKTVNCGIVRIHWATGHTVHLNDTHIIESKGIKERLDSFFSVDGLGEHCTLKCGSCKCGKCVIGQSNHSLKEERELNIIKSGMTHDQKNNQWTVRYPWIKDPSKLPNNITSAKARLVSTEKRLLRTGLEYANLYDDQIKDMVKRGIARKLSRDEIDRYEGPTHYVPHHEILKPESKSTPVRIVFNSSASYMGHSLNDYWAKGSNIMNDLLAVLIRFRQEHVALVGDISKMYNAVKLAPQDQHTHRFLWRNLETHRDPDHYSLLTVTFGDRPSGAIATLALRQTAEMYKTIYPKSAKMVIKNSYVDDLLQSVESKKEALTIAKNTERMLAIGGFVIKHWIISDTDALETRSENEPSERDNEINNVKLIESENEKILGMRWDPKADSFTFKVKVNFSAKHRNVRSGDDISREQIDEHMPECLTPRMVLSQVSSIYDPLGLVTPYTLEAKILLRKLFLSKDQSENGSEDKYVHWDRPISGDARLEWNRFFKGLFDVEALTFQRCLKPYNSVGDPLLVIFSDGSNLAYGTCAYARWELRDGTFEARLIIAKNRIAPTKQQSIPRLELCGALLGARVREKLEREMDYKFSRVIHIVDSTIVRAQINRESYGFGTFVATRIAEIQNKTEPCDWWWVPSDQNVADLTTRISSAVDIKTNVFWQTGPAFLKLPLNSWPIRQDVNVESKELPDAIGVAMTIDVSAIDKKSKVVGVCGNIQVQNVSSFRKLLKVTCILMKVAKAKSFKSAAVNISADELLRAKNAWIRYLQTEIGMDWRTRYQRLAPDLNKDGIIVVGKRLCDWLKFTWNKTELVLLLGTSQFVRLYLKTIHNRDHAGVDVTLARSRSEFWIPGARRIIKSIKEKCVICKKRDGPYNGQIMGNLPIERMLPSPPFTYCSVDLFGPFLIKDTVKGRTRGKAYGVLFNCMSSRAVYVDLAEGYDTSSFITVLRRFVSIRGYPKKMRSDSGSQLVSASKELKESVKKWDVNTIRDFGKSNGMEWEFTKSADAPWENGCSESLIRSVKRSLILAIGQSIMTFSELQTVMFEVSNIINERPIGAKTNDPNDGSYLCPNDLLLGRASATVPSGEWNEPENPKKRWQFVQQVVHSFWKKWQRDYFPSLIVRQKWHNSRRNIRVGDIVMIHDNGNSRGKWKIGQVTEANPGRDGSVRDVSVRYKNVGCGSEYKGQQDTVVRRSVHRLVVLLPVEDQIVCD